MASLGVSQNPFLSVIVCVGGGWERRGLVELQVPRLWPSPDRRWDQGMCIFKNSLGIPVLANFENCSLFVENIGRGRKSQSTVRDS